jgi:hypothetical protein
MTIFKLEVEIDVPHAVQPLHYKPLMDLIIKISSMPETISWSCEVPKAITAMGDLMLEEDRPAYEAIYKRQSLKWNREGGDK